MKTDLKECKFCNKKFNIFSLKRHLSNCVSKKEKESENKISELSNEVNENKEYIEELKTKIQLYENNLLSRPQQPMFQNLNSNNKDMTFKLTLENGKVMDIGIRSDGYINATELCKAGGKRIDHYKENKQTQDYLQALSFNTGISVIDLINSNVGGNHSGTYVHRKVGYHIAQWISPDFAVQVSNVLDNFENKLTNVIHENNELKSKIQIYESNIYNQQPMFQNLNNNGILVLNDITIVSRTDGYINLSQLCKAGNKEYKHWKENKNTKLFLQVLSSSVGIPTDEILIYETGSNQNRATWGHPQVAINIAQWISPEFNVQVSKWIFELMITGKVEIGNQKSNEELENIYKVQINNLNNRLKNYETNVFQNNIESCPIQYYGKDIVYFFKFDIPYDLKNKYVSKYENINNENYSCVEFGVSSNFEERLKQHKSDKKKNNLIFLYAIEFNKRYLASKIEKYIKTIIKQMNINLDYEKKKECFIANEDEFNIIINKIKDGLNNIENTDVIEDDEEEQINNYDDNQVFNTETIKYKYDMEKQIKIKKIEIELEIEKEKISIEKERIQKEIEIKKIETITELFKNKLINLEEYKSMMKF